MDLLLVRDLDNTRQTMGILEADTLIVQTLELPWCPEPGAICGRPDRSCVPLGRYELMPHNSPAHPYTFALVNPSLCVVHDTNDMASGCIIKRSEVLIHAANWVDQLEGCIAVGLCRLQDQKTGQWMLTRSDDALARLLAILPWTEGHSLTIVNQGVPL